MGHLADAIDRGNALLQTTELAGWGSIPIQAAVTGWQVVWTAQLYPRAKPGVYSRPGGPSLGPGEMGRPREGEKTLQTALQITLPKGWGRLAGTQRVLWEVRLGQSDIAGASVALQNVTGGLCGCAYSILATGLCRPGESRDGLPVPTQHL